MLTQPGAQNVAVALLTGHLLEQANSILQPWLQMQYDTLMLRDIAKESMNSFLNQILSSREDTKTKYKVSQNVLLWEEVTII